MHDSGAGGELDAPLLGNMRGTTELANCDGAGDGKIAVRDLFDKDYLYALKVRNLDVSHGARRLTSRPWQADALTQEVTDNLIFGKHSLTHLLDNSPEFQHWLQGNLKRCVIVVGVDSLSACGQSYRAHRYDSCQVPLSRFVLRLEAQLICTGTVLGRIE